MKVNNRNLKYFKVSSQILKCHLSPMELSVYFAIASFINKQSDTAIVRYKTIANRLGVSTRSVARSVKALSQKDLISLTKRYTADGYRLCYSFKLRSFVNGFKLSVPYDAFNLSPAGLTIFAHLLVISNKVNGFASISLRKLSKKSEISIPTIISVLNELEDKNLIFKRYYLKLNGGLGVNHYIVLSINSDYHSCGTSISTKLNHKGKKYIIEYVKSNKQDIILEFKIIKNLA